MYDQYFSDLKSRMQPVVDLAETNRKTMETLATLQKDTMTEVINASVEQFKALSKCADPQSVLDLQIKFYKSLEAKMTNTAEKSIAAVSEAKDAFVAVVEESAKKTAEEVEAAVEKVSGKAA